MLTKIQIDKLNAQRAKLLLSREALLVDRRDTKEQSDAIKSKTPSAKVRWEFVTEARTYAMDLSWALVEEYGAPVSGLPDEVLMLDTLAKDTVKGIDALTQHWVATEGPLRT
jgi:hypothetical protein